MQNSNELFKTFILNQLSLAKRKLITGLQAHDGINGYYKALKDLNGVDDLTTLYRDLAGYVYGGTTTQATNARYILEGKASLSDLLER
jgi:hypothetical protein